MNATIVTLLRLAVFLMPVAFWPFTFEIFEFSKQNILWFLVAGAAALWLVQNLLIAKKITYHKTPLDIPIVVMLAVWGLGVVFGVDWFSSLFGYYGRFSDAYLSTVSFALFYFLTVNTLTPRQALSFFHTFLLAGGIALAGGLAAMFGLLAPLAAGGGRLGIMAAPSFNPAGASSESLAMLAAALLVLLVALYSYRVSGSLRRTGVNIMYGALGGLAVAVLAAVNFIYAWTAALAGLALLFAFALYLAYVSREAQSDKNIEVAVAPALSCFVVGLLAVFLFAGSGSIFGISLPREVVLPAAETRAVVWGSVKTHPLFGYGPGAFAYAFSEWRPASFNASQFWQLRFDKAPVYLLELAGTVGLLGLASYLATVGVFLFVSFVFLRNLFRHQSAESYLAFGFSFLAATLFIAQALYITNTTLLFCFWFALALAMLNWRFAFGKIFTTVEINLRGYRDVAPIVSVLAITGVGIFLGLAYLQARYYAADVLYNNFRLAGKPAALERAIGLNPHRANYALALARHYMGLARGDIALLGTPDDGRVLTGDERAVLQDNIQRAIRAAELATAAAPKAVSSWEMLGAIYRDVRLIAIGSVEPAIRYFETASRLEPTNPVLLTELGNLYAAHSQTNDAVAALERARAYKPDYAPAVIGLAKTYDALGQTDKALVELEGAIRRAPTPETVYESGRLYYNQGNMETAIERFNLAVILRPDYANAIYSLGLAYQKQGDIPNALLQFQRVLAMNPENTTVRALVEELRGESGEDADAQTAEE